ncbi:penicillin-binding protein 1A [Pandoraea anhela]|uniref:penicillin-binding protein 1A n=1 Tax=Pandoraea anhela TaxID=2508295 RepID=UPI0015825CCA|nr:PBP1A family penicillin-binding protein [Pandoraea anhela]
MRLLLMLTVAGVTAMSAIAAYVVIVVYPEMPNVASLADYRPTEPLRIYSADNALLAEYGIEKRRPLKYDEIPACLRNALLATEDVHFFEHDGIDLPGLVRATLVNVFRGEKSQGGSTITMQLARNFFLTRQKTYARKLYEILLALKIERALSKPQILTLYMNQIYLGERAYGFGAAAKVYYAKTVDELTLDECAMLAGLPKAPATYNPIVNPGGARERQVVVLNRMQSAGFISHDDYLRAVHAPVFSAPQRSEPSVPASSVSETVRQLIVNEFGDEAYESGLRVWTTIVSDKQRAAADAVQASVDAYQDRQAYAGPEAKLPQALMATFDAGRGITPKLASFLESRPDFADTDVAVVGAVGAVNVSAYLASGEKVSVALPGVGRQRALARSRVRARPIEVGDIVRIRRLPNGARKLVSLPAVQASLIAIAPDDGAILAMVGDNGVSGQHFNRVIQASRQPGSAFKPFLYAAALADGYGPTTAVFDLPIEVTPAPGAPVWRPRADGRALGEITLSTALARSRNFVAVRLAQAVGLQRAQAFIVRNFGFRDAMIPANLPMALGAGAVTPLEMAVGYAVFANGGYRVSPYLIARIVDASGAERFRAKPQRARVIDPSVSYLMSGMLREVAQRGTASATRSLKRQDIGGKTGTTNDYRDGWFAGYQKTIATVAWMGFDAPRSLGPGEWASKTALPMWIHFMGKALSGVPEAELTPPDDIVDVDDIPYDKAHTPGHGFVERLTQNGDVERTGSVASAPLAQPSPPASSAAAHAGAVADVSSQERQRILQYFLQP